MSAIVCLSWTCSFSMSMVSRSLAFIVCIHWEFRQTCRVRFKSWCHQLSTHKLLRVCAGVEHHAVTDIDPVQSFNANKVFLQSGLMSSCRVASLPWVLVGAWKNPRPREFRKPSRVHRAWCHPVKMTDGAHFARQRQRVYDLVLKSEVDDALVKRVQGADESQYFEHKSELLHRFAACCRTFPRSSLEPCSNLQYNWVLKLVGESLLFSCGSYLAHCPSRHSNTLSFVKHRQAWRHSQFCINLARERRSIHIQRPV